MAKAKRYYYLVDSLDSQRGEVISKGLKAISSIEGVKIDLSQGIVEVLATAKPDTNVQIACEVAGTVIRSKIKKSRSWKGCNKRKSKGKNNYKKKTFYANGWCWL